MVTNKNKAPAIHVMKVPAEPKRPTLFLALIQSGFSSYRESQQWSPNNGLLDLFSLSQPAKELLKNLEGL